MLNCIRVKLPLILLDVLQVMLVRATRAFFAAVADSGDDVIIHMTHTSLHSTHLTVLHDFLVSELSRQGFGRWTRQWLGLGCAQGAVVVSSKRRPVSTAAPQCSLLGLALFNVLVVAKGEKCTEA